jgi:hypothetical protein
MRIKNKSRRAGDAATRERIRNWLDGPSTDTRDFCAGQAPLRAELIGADTCTALRLSARGAAPILALCRRLIEAGHDPAMALEVYRGKVLALAVRSIGEGAGLDVNSKGSGFVRSRTVRTAPPVRQNGGREGCPYPARSGSPARPRHTEHAQPGCDGES